MPVATIVKIAYQQDFTTAEVTLSQFFFGIIVLFLLSYQKRKTEKLPDWFGKEYADEKEIDTKTNDALQKRLENLKNKRPKNK